MGIPELEALSNCARQWLDKAVEAYDEEEYEAVDAAYRMSAGHIELAQLEIEKEKLEMARERHRVETRKRREALQALQPKVAPAEPLKPTGWEF